MSETPDPVCPRCGGEPNPGYKHCYTCTHLAPSRAFSRNWSILNTSDEVYPPFKAYKYDKDVAGGHLLARILAGFCAANLSELKSYDHIIQMPWHAGGGAPFDHMRPVIRFAAERLSELPFAADGSLLVKTRATASQAGDKQRRGARTESFDDRYDALAVSDGAPSLAGARILIVDDVFTTGTTLNAAAHRLKDAGAADVCGVSIFRHT